jgi:hypothetical protein
MFGTVPSLDIPDASYTDFIERVANRTLSLEEEAVLLIVKNVPLTDRKIFDPPQFFRAYVGPSPYLLAGESLFLTADGLESPEIQPTVLWAAANRTDLIFRHAGAGEQCVNIVLWEGQYYMYITDRKLIESSLGYCFKLKKLSLLGPAS